MSLENRDIGHYHLLRLLGEGGMGEVYLADDKNVKRQVAVKVVKTQVNWQDANDKKIDMALKLFQREAGAIARMSHPHILTLHEYAQDKIGEATITYMVMPYCPEGSFAAWLKRRGGGPLPSEDVVYFIKQAADALQSAHKKQIVHQDVKPDNFLIRHRDNAPLPDLLLADFGVARLLSASGSITDTARGTLSYMAPEQWKGNPVFATDQYALAVMTYQLLTGQLPFKGTTTNLMYQHSYVQPELPSHLNPKLSHAIDEVVIHGMQKRPEERYASIMDFADKLQNVIAPQKAGQEYHLRSTVPAPPVDRRQTIHVEIPFPPDGRSTSSVAGIPPLRPNPSTSREQGVGSPLNADGRSMGSFQLRDGITLPVDSQKKSETRERKQRHLPTWVVAVAVVLLLVAILMLLNTALQGFLFGIAAIGALLLGVIYTLFLSRWIGMPLILAQLVLLAGASYHHFGWHMGAATPVFAVLASLESLFWVLFSAESVGAIALFYYVATR